MSSIAKLENNTDLDNTPSVSAEDNFRFLVSLEHERTLPPAIRNLITHFVAEFTSQEPVSLLIVAPHGISTQQGNEMREAIQAGGSSSSTCADIEVAHTDETSALPFTAAVLGDPTPFAAGLPQVQGTQQALRQAFSASTKLRNALTDSKNQ